MNPTQASHQSLEASELFCRRCNGSRPVRKRLLLILPTGNKYDYLCVSCGSSVGGEMDERANDFHMTGLLVDGRRPDRR
ncbi:MAG: hypothetical protein ACE5ID_02015 [Acidobacteriota bacterium]